MLRYSFAAFLTWYLFALPSEFFNDPTSTVLFDRNGKLLGARIAPDGQWRFEESETVPYKMAQCLITFEDKHFFTHVGISATGISRALRQNFSKGRVVSGGSTITMQLVRMMRKNPPRTYFEKILEMILATRVELRYSKDEILALYASHAPFGNNVVGLDAAAWRYFNRKAAALSWAECATLAVLPNAPSLIYPGKNHDELLRKRNRLLKQLYDEHKISAIDYEVALSEPLPEKPLSLPRLADHLLAQFAGKGKAGQNIYSSLEGNLQERCINLLNEHQPRLASNGIMNAAVIVTSVRTGQVLAYIGNTTDPKNRNGNQVNCAAAPRSTGSILKPFLYAKCLESGQITPSQLVSDVPVQYYGFAPKNFAGTYDGAIPVDQALSRSLNVPMVQLLSEYGSARFRDDLLRYGFHTIHHPAKHYGLSLILGGAEVRLEDLSRAYMQMAQELRFGSSTDLLFEQTETKHYQPHTNRGATWSTFQAMIEVSRPDENNQWKVFSSSQPIAWKTGTSFGFRDAWAVGITPDYVISVWVGNADGEGRPGLTGVKAAAPLLFDLFRLLPNSPQWFKKPARYLKQTVICAESGFRASKICPHTVTRQIPKTCKTAPLCPYHVLIHLDRTRTYRADTDCEEAGYLKHEVWFVLPPLMERYYRSSHPEYKTLPVHNPACKLLVSDNPMHIVYPQSGAVVYVPVTLTGNRSTVIFEATHRNGSQPIYWHLDDQFLSETREIHQIEVSPSPGRHKLTLIDANGITTSANFEVVRK